MAVAAAAMHRWRYSSSVISVALLGVAAERGGDPTVNRSHGGEEGGGIKDDDDDKYHDGGGGEVGALLSCCRPLLL